MSDTDKGVWLLWKVLSTIVLVSTIAFLISSHGIQIELNLIEGEKINVKLLRILPHNLSLKFIFARVTGKPRPEMGEWETISDWRETRVLKFKNPGEPIKLVVSDTHQNVVYEALPSGGGDSRDLILYYEDNDPCKFWPSEYGGDSFLVNAGYSEFQITILEAGKSFIGEKVVLYIAPPLGFKHTPNGFFYKYLWFFYAWPVYVFILSIFYILLALQKRRENKNISQ